MARARSKPCRTWLERDADGRPRCEHGWAIKAGPSWRCRLKHLENCRRYDATPAGRKVTARQNASDIARLRKQVYELTRIRIGG